MFDTTLVLMTSNVGNVLRTARKQRGYVQRQVAEVAGVSVAAVGQWERGDNDISMENLRQVCRFLGIDAVAANAGELRYLEADPDLSEVERVTDPQPLEVGPADIEIRGVTVGGDDGDFSINGQVVGYARRPPGIARLRNVFVVNVMSDSMSPRFEHGDPLFCGGREPTPGDDVVIEMFPTGNEQVGKSYVKRLVKRQGGQIVCRQFNPPKELTFSQYEIKAIYRVIPLKELWGS